jgi:hypothetical protein
MCRSIKVLRNPDQPATAEEVSGAALQFVRKITGYHKPSKANREAFDRAVQEITDASRRLLQTFSVPSGGIGHESSSPHGNAERTELR